MASMGLHDSSRSPLPPHLAHLLPCAGAILAFFLSMECTKLILTSRLWFSLFPLSLIFMCLSSFSSQLKILHREAFQTTITKVASSPVAFVKSLSVISFITLFII